ncbi:MAG: DUF5690 family protein [Spirosomataceae bacterium]
MRLKELLAKQSSVFLSFYLTLTAFTTYFCVYALRKPFTAGTFEGMTLWGIDYKIVLVIAHVLGYASSKGLGIKVISEVKPERRAGMILFFVGVALLALLGFALVPAPYNWIFMYFNGLPLGMIYGLVFGYLEGRRVTEILGAGLCISFIVSSGVVKSVGRWLIVDIGLSDYWMPFWAGVLFLPLLVLAVWGLNLAPPPNAEDEQLRTERVPMNATERRAFFGLLAPGLLMLIAVYIFVTILRDVRDNFAVEIFKEAGVTDISVFTLTETLVGLGITVLAGFLFVIKDNKVAYWVNLLFVGAGMLLVTCATWLFESGQLGAIPWMTWVGLGIYMAYVPYNCTLFERLIAVMRRKSNVGFLLYMADFAGYLGSVAIILVKNFGSGGISWLHFYVKFAYLMPLFSVLILGVAALYFRRKFKIEATY